MIGVETSQDVFIQIVNYADKFGAFVILILALVGLHREWWVPGWMHRAEKERFEKLEQEKDAWRETALKASDVATDAFTELRRRA